jgi:hypothetical protein
VNEYSGVEGQKKASNSKGARRLLHPQRKLTYIAVRNFGIQLGRAENGSPFALEGLLLQCSENHVPAKSFLVAESVQPLK